MSAPIQTGAEIADAYRSRRDAADAMYEVLCDLMENPLYQTAIGGNPSMVERLIDRANSALRKARGEVA